jgi:hypothetical protein
VDSLEDRVCDENLMDDLVAKAVLSSCIQEVTFCRCYLDAKFFI